MSKRKKKKLCIICKGKGILQEWSDPSYGHGGGDFVDFPCRECSGTGIPQRTRKKKIYNYSLIYLFIIILLVSTISIEFYSFTKHYEALERVAYDTLQHCKL